MKKGMNIEKLSGELKKIFIGKKFSSCNRRNKKPADGWTTCGQSGITRAIKLAGLPWNQFWSGSNPTPSTQAPEEIIKMAYEIGYRNENKIR